MGRWEKSEPGESVGDSLEACRETGQARPPQRRPFLRKAWVSVDARHDHEPDIRRVSKAWELVEWRSADHVRPCAIAGVLSTDYADALARFEAANLTARPLRVISLSPEQADNPLYLIELVLGSRRNVKKFRAAWRADEHDTIGALLGYPACCRTSFHETGRAMADYDPEWQAALASPKSANDGSRLSLQAPWQTNILLRRLGIRAIPHFPCRFDCENSSAFGHRMTALMDELGHGEEAASLRNILNWPMQWSALHGIAEIRTPVLKIVTHAAQPAGQRVLDWQGSTMPAHAATGLQFPYRRARTARSAASHQAETC